MNDSTSTANEDESSGEETTEPMKKRKVRKKAEPGTTRIYSYGANPPLENLEEVVRQFRLAHDYRNALAKIEIERRDRVSVALAELEPELVPVEAEIKKIEAEIEERRKEGRKENSRKRAKVPSDSAKASIRALTKQQYALERRRGELRSKTFKRKEWNGLQKIVDDWASDENTKAYAAARAQGTCWGTCVEVNRRVLAWRRNWKDLPRVRGWDGGGKVVVQLQGGLEVPVALAGTDTQLRVEPRPDGVWIDGSRRKPDGTLWKRKLGTAIVKMRIGTIEGSTKPIWCEIPIHLHRPLPEDAQIKWAWLRRYRIGTAFKWEFQFTLSRSSWPRPEGSAKTGSVGVDVGWRTMPDGRLRVAAWVGSDGERGEVFLPHSPARPDRPARDWLSHYEKTDAIHGDRDKLFNAAREILAAWLRTKENVPDWLKESTATMSSWRSISRLAVVALKWRKNRFDGDSAGFETLEVWRKRDKHLYLYEANVRHQLLGQRMQTYREFAAMLRRKYATAVVEDLDFREFHKNREFEEDDDNEADRIKQNSRAACLSDLFRCLKEALTIVEVPAKKTTLTCAECGSEEKWDHRKLDHTCSACGKTWDQDFNAAKNILARGLASG